MLQRSGDDSAAEGAAAAAALADSGNKRKAELEAQAASMEAGDISGPKRRLSGKLDVRRPSIVPTHCNLGMCQCKARQ